MSKINNFIDDENKIARYVSRFEGALNENFLPEAIAQHNATLTVKKNILGRILTAFYRIGWIALIALAGLYLLNTLLDEVEAMFTVFTVLKPIGWTVSLMWVALWLIYWNAPLKHCPHCEAMFARDVVYEKKVPGTTYDRDVTRTVQQDVKDRFGKVIGKVDQEVTVTVRSEAFYTVFKCKKCQKMQVGIVIKHHDR